VNLTLHVLWAPNSTWRSYVPVSLVLSLFLHLLAASHDPPLNYIYLNSQDNTWMERLFNCSSYIYFPFRCFAARVIHIFSLPRPSTQHNIAFSSCSDILLLIAFLSPCCCTAERDSSSSFQHRYVETSLVTSWPVKNEAKLADEPTVSLILHVDGFCVLVWSQNAISISLYKAIALLPSAWKFRVPNQQKLPDTPAIYKFTQTEFKNFMECLPCIFYKIENNDIQRMHFSMFIIYTNTPTRFGPSGPSSGSYRQ
jgi:hypothetical protein